VAQFRITLVGSRYFGAATLARLLEESVDIARVLVPAADDRLALAAASAGLGSRSSTIRSSFRPTRSRKGRI
jgi:hypothetical protein